MPLRYSYRIVDGSAKRHWNAVQRVRRTLLSALWGMDYGHLEHGDAAAKIRRLQLGSGCAPLAIASGSIWDTTTYGQRSFSVSGPSLSFFIAPYTVIPGLQQAVQILHLALSCLIMSCNFMYCIFIFCTLQFGPRWKYWSVRQIKPAPLAFGRTLI